MGTAVRRRRWAVVLLVVYLVVVAIIVFTPVSYGAAIAAIASELRVLHLMSFGTGWIDFVANILMFVPLGFLLTLVFRHPTLGTVLALILSIGAELAQLVIPDRVTSLRDIVSNTLGAALGSLIAWVVVWVSARRRARVHVSAD